MTDPYLRLSAPMVRALLEVVRQGEVYEESIGLDERVGLQGFITHYRLDYDGTYLVRPTVLGRAWAEGYLAGRRDGSIEAC